VTPGRRTDEEIARLASELAETEQSVEQSASVLTSRHRRSAGVLRLLRGVMREQAQEEVGLAASGAAFWLIIAAFPTAIAVVNVFGLVERPGDVANDLGGLARAGPSTFGAALTAQLQRVAAADHVGLSTGLAISLVLAIWSASGGVYNLDRAIRTAYGLRPQRYVDARGRALVGAVITVLALGVVAFISAGISGELAHVPAVVVAVVAIPVLMVFAAAAIGGLKRL
jgi:membrane protein